MTTATAAEPRITVGSTVQFPHQCSRCNGLGTVALLTCGGMYAHQREDHECGQQFAHVTSACNRFRVLYTADLVEA